MSRIEIINADSDNIADHGFCGYKSIKQEGYKRKVDWLKERFSEGLVFKVLHSSDDGDVGFIEYVPGEYAWRGIDAPGHMMIHCILIVPKKIKGEGYGSLLVEECLKDARREKMRGVAVVTRKGTWMAGKELFLKNGFEVADDAPPDFELLVKSFRKGATPPRFRGDWDARLRKYGSGLTILRSDQCPYVAKAVRGIVEISESQYGLKVNLVELADCRDARRAPTPFGVFSIAYNGRLLADHPISSRRFTNIMKKELTATSRP